MSSLGFQTVYKLLNNIENVVCERAFLPHDTGRIITAESGRLVSEFDIIAFSVSYENDYLNLLTILQKAKLPLLADHRENSHPLVVAGGVACILNPEPIASFIDCFLIGEAENLVPRFTECINDAGWTLSSSQNRKSCLKHLAGNVPGAYVPEFYRDTFHADGTLCSFEPLNDAPAMIERIYSKDLSNVQTCSAILTPDTTFERVFLTEVGRGCPHGCRFCSAGYVFRPPRFRPVPFLEECIKQGREQFAGEIGKMAAKDNRERAKAVPFKVGLVGAAVSDLPGIAELCGLINQEDTSISFSSLRADALSPEIVSALRQSRVKTATIAPDAGSERMRKVINKGITEENVLNACETLVLSGIMNLKLYFMIGLPTETADDVEAIVELCRRIKQRFLESSRTRKKIGEITVSLNSFVPKPVTPFQWAAMDDVGTLKKKISIVKKGLKKTANVRVHADIPRHARIQALLSRGDRRVGDILSAALFYNGNWARTLKESDVSPDYYIHRERDTDELLPWDFIDHGIKKSFLEQEFKKAKQGKISLPCRMDSCNICGVC
ncbi:MAG: radical SAM protein [Desulfobacteraceae bacterium]|nr:radical SAM protein [Desulfobacteraceae bacterium]